MILATTTIENLAIALAVGLISFLSGWVFKSEAKGVQMRAEIDAIKTSLGTRDKVCDEHRGKTDRLEKGFNDRTPLFERFQNSIDHIREAQAEMKEDIREILTRLKEK